MRRGTDWLLAMQNRDGGWAAFDVDIDNEVLTKVPFADHNAMLDPSCADITARILEMLGTLGYRADHPAIARGLDYLWRTQEPEGCWYGRWGVNYIYGTWQVLQGLKAHRLPDEPPGPREGGRLAGIGPAAVRRLGRDLCAATTTRRSRGRVSRPPRRRPGRCSGLIAAGRAEGDAVRRGIDYLLETQSADGSWDEAELHRHGLPPGLLSEVPSLSDLLPAHGDLALPPGRCAAAAGHVTRAWRAGSRAAPAARLDARCMP